MQSSAGWDWIQATPDRNTGPGRNIRLVYPLDRSILGALSLGIWDTVALVGTGLASVADAFVRTVSVEVASKLAVLRGQMSLSYLHSSLTPQPAAVLTFLRVRQRGDFAVSASVELFAEGQERLVTLPDLTLAEVRLWWPHSLGAPELYEAQMGAVTCHANRPSCWQEVERLLRGVDDSESLEQLLLSMLPSSCLCALSDSVALSVGIRKLESFIDDRTQGRAFRVNEQPLFLTGGNWIASDQLLRHRRLQDCYLDELDMHRRMGMSLVRVWGGGIAERPEFYAACDQLGLLVYQEFWMTGAYSLSLSLSSSLSIV